MFLAFQVKFDVRLLPKELAPLAWLVGRWRSEFGGKVFFSTIPKFTYWEQINRKSASLRNPWTNANYKDTMSFVPIQSPPSLHQPRSSVKMLLALMQPNDLKKVFTKMECTEFSKLYRTSKWVYNFLEDTTEDVMIFAHRYIIISPMELADGRFCPGMTSIANTRNGGSPFQKEGAFRHNYKFCPNAYGLDFPKICKAKFLVDTLNIVTRHERQIEKAINCAISQGIKRVKRLHLENETVKPSRSMFEKLRPQHVRACYLSYRELPGFWNILSEMSAKKGCQMVVTCIKSVVELERNCAKVEISSEESNSEIVPWIANQTKNFHKDNILKGLEMRVALPGDPEIDRYFPNPTVSFLPQESVFPVHYFVFSALTYSTFVEVRWIHSEEGSLKEVRCRNCENSEEAANFLRDSCKMEEEYFRGSWKQIVDDCFN